MPYFSWQGIGLSGKLYRGKSFALSAEVLDAQLFKRDIALLTYKPARTIFLPTIYFGDKIVFFERLAALLGASVLIPEALVALVAHLPKARLQLIIEQVTDDIQQGYSLSNALEKYPTIFDRMIVQMVHVGQEAGKLAAAMAALVAYLNSLQEFRQKVRAAALMPLLSLIFFVGIVLLILLVMLPRLVDIVGMAQQQVPTITRVLLSIGKFLQGWAVIGIGAALICLFFLIRSWLRRPKGKLLRDKIILRMPLLRDLAIASQMGWFCASVALLIRNGVAVVPALSIAEQTVRNEYLCQSINTN